jgi:addiction module HigA family antidote
MAAGPGNLASSGAKARRNASRSSIIVSEVKTRMTNQDRLPSIHPGEILREEFLSPLGMSANELALALRVPATRINDIVNEKRGITADTALRLSRYFGTTSRFWMNMQASWELEVAEDQLGHAVRREVLPRTA